MVRGFGPIHPMFQLNLRPERVDVGNIQGADFSGVANDFFKNFQSGVEFGNKQLGNKKAASLLDEASRSTSPAATLLGLGAQGGPYAGGSGTDTIAQPQPFDTRSVPSFAQAGGGAPKQMPSSTFWNDENRQAIIQEATAAGLNPEDLATVMSYETGGTLNPWQKGPTTKWGQHRGLIQWGEPQRQQYGVTEETPFRDQVKASIKYLQDRGLKPGMGMLEMYSAINAGGISQDHFNRSDEGAGGAPGTVRDKVNNQMLGHRRRAQAWLGRDAGMPAPGAVMQPAPSPQQVAPQTQASSTPVSASPTAAPPPNVRQQAQDVLDNPDGFDPRTIQWARGIVGTQAPAQAAAAPQLAPSPQDREAAAAVTENQVQTVTAGQQPQMPTFMGIPAMQPQTGAAGLAGGTGTDQIVGNDGTNQTAAPQPQPQPAPVQAQPQAAPYQAAPAAPRSAAQYRPPVQAGPRGLDPRVMQALAAAVAGGDPTAVSGVQTAIQAMARGQSSGNISLEQLPDGSTVLFNKDTGEVSPYSHGTGATKAPTVQSINGIDHQWTGNGWQPLGTAQAKAPETKEVGGQLYQWDGASRAWVPALPGAPSGGLQTIAPDDKATRRNLGIPDNDNRIYQRNPTNNKLEPISEQRAIDDKAFTQENELFKGFTSEPVVRKYRGLEQGVQGLAGAFSQGNAAGDMVGVIQLFKAIDPESTVSAGEQASPSNAAGVPETLRRIYNKALGEGGSFSPQLRADMFNTTRALYTNQRAQVERLANETRNRAKRYGLNPENVVEFNPPDIPKATPDMFPDRAAPPDVPAAPPPLHLNVVPRGTPTRSDRGAADAFDLNTNPPARQPNITVRRLED